jgi:ABC-type transport system involved in multi-copper enzyme maturation permease subunit
MRRLYIGILILLIILLCGLFNGASATTESGTATINEEEYYTWIITLPNEGKLSYEINVTNGLLIDVILYDEQNYNIFLDGQPSDYVQEGTDLFTTNAKKSVNLPSGTYYLVADNTQEGLAIPDWDDDVNNSATFDYTVTYTLSEDDSWWNFLILGGIIIVIIIVVVVIMKKKT